MKNQWDKWDVSCDRCETAFTDEWTVRANVKFVKEQFVCASCLANGQGEPERTAPEVTEPGRDRAWESRTRNVQTSAPTRQASIGFGPTEKQRRYAWVLARQSRFDSLEEAFAEFPEYDGEMVEMSKREFSSLLDWLKTQK